MSYSFSPVYKFEFNWCTTCKLQHIFFFGQIQSFYTGDQPYSEWSLPPMLSILWLRFMSFIACARQPRKKANHGPARVCCCMLSPHHHHHHDQWMNSDLGGNNKYEPPHFCQMEVPTKQLEFLMIFSIDSKPRMSSVD